MDLMLLIKISGAKIRSFCEITKLFDEYLIQRKKLCEFLCHSEKNTYLCIIEMNFVEK